MAAGQLRIEILVHLKILCAALVPEVHGVEIQLRHGPPLLHVVFSQNISVTKDPESSEYPNLKKQ